MSVIALRLALLSSVALIAFEVQAQTPAPRPPTELEEISVNATRTPTPLSRTTGTVTTFDRTQLDRQSTTNPRDLVRYEPGVSIGNSPNRAGLGNYNIRGIDGNRVLVLIDGVRAPDFPASTRGPGLYTRDTVDFESLKRIEIIRGPASALYGSDAIGGVVAYTTKDPGDYLREVGRDWYLGSRFGASTVDRSLRTTQTGAVRFGPVEVLGQVSWNGFREPRPNDPGVSFNTQDGSQISGLSKVIWRPTETDALRLTVEQSRRSTDTQLRTDLGTAQGVRIDRSDATDVSRRTRLSLDWEREAPLWWVDGLKARVYFHTQDRTEHRDQLRVPTGSTQARQRLSDNGFAQDLFGIDLQFENRFDAGPFTNRLIYGFDSIWTETTRPRNQLETNLATGVQTRIFAGEVFPNKTFPDTRTQQGGLFVQNEMRTGNWTVVPAIRFDYFKLDPQSDAAFEVNNTQRFKPVSISETAISPKLGATYRLAESLSFFGQYARGFRAPPYDDANLGFTNLLQGYEVLPNGNLKPETVDGFELGARGRFSAGNSYQISSFYNRYQNFIEQTLIGRRGNIQQFQARNLGAVEIWGVEARGSWRPLSEVTLQGSIAYARGENKDTGQPINSVDPIKLVAGARYDHPEQGWGIEAVGTHVFRKDETATAGGFVPSSYTLLDLFGYWTISEQFTVNLGLTNILDQRYFVWQDVQSLAANTAAIGRYASPGRAASIGVSIRF
jgi:hemoglobin/transferrin/lactoferrin receptor protein